MIPTERFEKVQIESLEQLRDWLDQMIAQLDIELVWVCRMLSRHQS